MTENISMTERVKLLSNRAGRSVWYDRHVGIVEVAGSNPAQSIPKCLDGCCCASTVTRIYEADSG